MISFSSDSFFYIVMVAYLCSDQLLQVIRDTAHIEAWMHRVIYRRNCPKCLRGFVGNFGRHADEEFQHCRLKFYEQKISNVSELIMEWIQIRKASWSGNKTSTNIRQEIVDLSNA